MRSSLFGRLLALFLVVPIAELILLVWIGERVGIWPTVGLIVLTALVGSWLARREGMAALRRFQARMTTGQLPGRELTDGLIILVAAALLLTPGILTDVVGLLGLLPPSRAWIRGRLQARFQKNLARGNTNVFVMRSPTGLSVPSEDAVEDATILNED